jgi:hypothetical protein
MVMVVVSVWKKMDLAIAFFDLSQPRSKPAELSGALSGHVNASEASNQSEDFKIRRDRNEHEVSILSH